MKKISVTGTKGKTTVVSLISKALLSFGSNVLRVDTTGHFINGIRKSTLEDSKRIWGLVPSVCPGRYLWELSDESSSRNNIAVLECSVGCSTHSGLGYGVHDIGIFLNVFEDHLGSSRRLRIKEDIAIHKSFIFNKISTNGFAIFNADDRLVVGQLRKIPKHLGIQKIPVGIDFEFFDINSHVSDGGKYITTKNGSIWLIEKNQETRLCDLSNLPWTFDGQYEPSVYNAMFVCAGVLSYYDYCIPENFQGVIESLRMDSDSGRLVVMRAQSGAMVIADYAHEKESLKKVGELSKSLVKPSGKNISVVRLAYDRTDQLITDTAVVIAKSFDRVIVYDKIDGHLRNAKPVRSKLFKQEVGKVSQQIYDTAVKINPNTERIIREDKAIQRAAEIAGENDVVVVIVNDDINRSMAFIIDSFKAEVL